MATCLQRCVKMLDFRSPWQVDTPAMLCLRARLCDALNLTAQCGQLGVMLNRRLYQEQCAWKNVIACDQSRPDLLQAVEMGRGHFSSLFAAYILGVQRRRADVDSAAGLYAISIESFASIGDAEYWNSYFLDGRSSGIVARRRLRSVLRSVRQ
jgi:hypothetical protein